MRDGPTLHSRRPIEKARCLALSENPTRQLWWQDRPLEKPKRFKCIMKQVIGSPFTGLLDASLETSIVDGLIAASKEAFDDPGLSRQDRTTWLKRLLIPRIKELKDLIGTQLSLYLKSIVSRLLDTETKLRWTPTSNNCQNFCDALIDLNIFGPLIANPSPVSDQEKPGPKLYLLSFVCRPAGYAKPKIKSKFDVPRGLTKEYLLRLRYGRHDEADIMDTLQEYWHDWKASVQVSRPLSVGLHRGLWTVSGHLRRLQFGEACLGFPLRLVVDCVVALNERSVQLSSRRQGNHGRRRMDEE